MAQTTQKGLTLSDVTYFGRQGIKVGAVLVVTLIIGRMVLTAGVAYWKATHPEPPPPPTVGFGLLPPIRFPEQAIEDKPTSYVLETPTGTLPFFGDRAKVFFMPRSAPSLLDDDRAKKVAAQLGYVFSPEILDSQTYRWSKSQPIESTFELNVESLTFSLATDYLSRPELLAQGNLPEGEEAVSRVKRFFSLVSPGNSDIATVSGQITYLRATGGDLAPAVSFSDADFVQVDLSRTPIDQQHPFYTPNGTEGIVHAIVTGGFSGDGSVVEMISHYQPIDYTQIHTYPLRSTQSAWKLMQAGEGYVAEKGLQDQAVIREVILGYYDDIEEQDYSQPIFIFKGDGGFLGYVPALEPAYIQAEIQ